MPETFEELLGLESAEPEAGASSPENSDCIAIVDGSELERLRDPAKMTKAMRRRRSVPIHGFVGTSGHGKSASMVRDTLPSLALGRTVVSTVEILDAHTGNPHPLYVPFHSWHQFEDLHDSDVLMDEITSIMDAQESTALPKVARRLIPQQRRRNNVIRWSGIDWDNVNRRLRQMTQAVTFSRGFMPDRAAVRVERGSMDAIPLWAPNRVFFLVTRDAQRLMASDDSKRISGEIGDGPRASKRPKALCREIWYGPGSLAFDSYRTLGEVSAVDGGCPRCGLKVIEGSCKGHDDDDTPNERPRARRPRA